MNKTINTIPESLANIMKQFAGHAYRPNGEWEFTKFSNAWCSTCSIKNVRFSAEQHKVVVCTVINDAINNTIHQKNYPKALQFSASGQPECTCYIPNPTRQK